MKISSVLVISLMIFASVANAELKIGYVDFARVMKESPSVVNEKKKMDREVEATKKKLGGLEKEVKKLKTKLERDASVMSESERQKIEDQIRQKLREAKRTQDEFREDVNRKNNQIVGALQKRVYLICQEIAEQENYDLLLHSGVLHVNEQIDITSKVMEKLKTFKE